MKAPAFPPNEAERLQELLGFDILDTPPETEFDDLTALAAAMLNVPTALVSLVDSERQWFKSHRGLDVRETPRDISFCGHVVADGRPLVVPDAEKDDRFSDNPLVKGKPPVRFYAGMPLVTSGGLTMGTLCVVDHRPRSVTPEQLDLLEKLARLTMNQMELRRMVRILAKRENTLQERFRYLLQVLDVLETGILVVDPSGIMTFAGDRLLRQLGLEGHEWNGLPVSNLPLEPQLDVNEWKVKPDGHLRKKVVTTLGLPVKRHLEVSVQPVPDGPETLWLFHDVTELRLHEADPLQGGSWLLGNSDAIWRIRQQVLDIGRGHWPVLIEGETGTGKELAARAVHEHSPRKGKAFLAINCAGLTESILGSQLFGHKKGSFTGATADQKGLFESAHGGTLFLDEVGDTPLSIQAHLLRVLETGEILPVGETRPRRVDVRVVAATHRDLSAHVSGGSFREDLLYRLRVGRIRMPALRDRKTDIPLLFNYFMEQACRAIARPLLRTRAEVWTVLAEHPWPGNVRELKHMVDYLVIHCKGNHVNPEDLPPEMGRATESVGRNQWQFGRQEILEALRQVRGNRSKAAKILGISRATLYRRLGELDIR